MSILGDALRESDKALKNPETSLKIGDKVKILHRDYKGENGTIVKKSENIFGAPLCLVEVITVYEAFDETEEDYVLTGVTSFYPHELEKS